MDTVNVKRRKGGGRKSFDGKYSKRQFERRLRNYFFTDYSVKKFVRQLGISRQSYYRYLEKYSPLKSEIMSLKQKNEESAVRQRREMFQWMMRNPDKPPIDYYFRDIDLVEVELTLFS